MDAKCNACSKGPPEVSLKRCAKCSNDAIAPENAKKLIGKPIRKPVVKTTICKRHHPPPQKD